MSSTSSFLPVLVLVAASVLLTFSAPVEGRPERGGGGYNPGGSGQGEGYNPGGGGGGRGDYNNGGHGGSGGGGFNPGNGGGGGRDGYNPGGSSSGKGDYNPGHYGGGSQGGFNPGSRSDRPNYGSAGATVGTNVLFVLSLAYVSQFLN